MSDWRKCVFTYPVLMGCLFSPAEYLKQLIKIGKEETLTISFFLLHAVSHAIEIIMYYLIISYLWVCVLTPTETWVCIKFKNNVNCCGIQEFVEMQILWVFLNYRNIHLAYINRTKQHNYACYEFVNLWCKV